MEHRRKKMVEQVEINSFDLRYEGYRMRNLNSEGYLCSSILTKGIQEPLAGINSKDKKILLDGFKRYRCAVKLSINILPYKAFGEDEVMGMLQLIRQSNAKSLTILEQARFITELKNVRGMGTKEIAEELEKSRAWVSMRTGLLEEIGEKVLERIMSGEFPAYAYMYTLRQFIRMKGVKKEEVAEFVEIVAGKKLSIREIEYLARSYFMGGDAVRAQIRGGNLNWSLSRMLRTSQELQGLKEPERKILSELELLQKYMNRFLNYKVRGFETKEFLVQAELLSSGILRQIKGFQKGMEDFHAGCGHKEGHICLISERNECEGDCQKIKYQSPNSEKNC